MSAKYPRLAFNARDVQDLLQVLREHITNLRFDIMPWPTKTDPDRVRVALWGFRAAPKIGQQTRVEAYVFVAGKGVTTFDRAMFDVAWKLLNEYEAMPHEYGTYTELFPGFPRASK